MALDPWEKSKEDIMAAHLQEFCEKKPLDHVEVLKPLTNVLAWF